MRNFFLVIVSFFAFASAAFAQKSVIVVFTDFDEPFVMQINGERVNEEPATNVKSHDLNPGNYRIAIRFQKSSLGMLTQNVMVEEGTKYTFTITTNRKGEFVIRYFGDSPYTPETKTSAQMKVSPDPQPKQEAQASISGQQSNTGSASISMSVQESGRKPEPTGTSVSMSISGSDAAMGISMKVEGEDSASESISFSTNVTTTSSQTGLKVTGTASEDKPNRHHPQPRPMEAQESAPVKSGCQGSMSQSDYERALSSIKSKTFEDTKITTIKQILKGDCVTVAQLSGILKTLTYEESKLEIAKFGYDYVVDKNRFYQINDVFTFSASVDELNKFLERKQ